LANGVERTPSPEGLAAPPGDYTSWDEYMADVERADVRSGDRFERVVLETEAQRRADYEANHELSLEIGKAMQLAPNTIVFRALLDGQQVPVSALDQHWARRYGLIWSAA